MTLATTAMRRRDLLLLLPPLCLAGCNGLSIRSQSPEDATAAKAEKRTLVGDVAVPFGMYPIKVEAVGLVTGLPGTGSDPAPSPERARLIATMQKAGIETPNQVLASPSTELVLVRGYLRPGIQKGDRFDLEVRVPTRSENAGLRGGWLIDTSLAELAAGGGTLHEGKEVGMGAGPVLVDPTVDVRNDKISAGRGRVLSGGVAKLSRPLGLVLKPDYRNVAASSIVGVAVNKRFHRYDKGIKVGIAKPLTDKYIELTLHPRYKDNVERFVRVVRAVPLKENAQEQLARLGVLERNLLDPITSASAALSLEAIGTAGIPVLKKGLQAADVEVRFYSAEALAYLDETSAAPVLGEIARNQPAFRAYALAALGAMDDAEAYQSLKGLLDVTSAETRYGAFRALWAMNAQEPLVRDQLITDEFHYHVLKTDGLPMVHFTRNTRPEVVVFGEDQKLLTPVSLEAGPRILVNSIDAEHLSVSRFVPGEPDQKRIISTSLDEMIRAVAELGGTYPDIVQVLQQAKTSKALVGRLEMEAIPQAGRLYERNAIATDAADELDAAAAAEAEEAVRLEIGTPKPDLFPGEKPSDFNDRAKLPAETGENSDDQPPRPSLWGRFIGKMAGK